MINSIKKFFEDFNNKILKENSPEPISNFKG